MLFAVAEVRALPALFERSVQRQKAARRGVLDVPLRAVPHALLRSQSRRSPSSVRRHTTTRTATHTTRHAWRHTKDTHRTLVQRKDAERSPAEGAGAAGAGALAQRRPPKRARGGRHSRRPPAGRTPRLHPPQGYHTHTPHTPSRVPVRAIVRVSCHDACGHVCVRACVVQRRRCLAWRRRWPKDGSSCSARNETAPPPTQTRSRRRSETSPPKARRRWR